MRTKLPHLIKSYEQSHSMTTCNPQRTNRPHLVPEMLLKHFQDANGKVLTYRKDESKLFSTSPTNVFVNKHRHTLRGEEYRGNPFEIETRLGEIESEAAPVIDKVIGCRKVGLYPSIVEEEGDAVKLFFFTLFLRTNYHADEIVPIDRYELDCRTQGFKQAEMHGVDKSEWQEFQDGSEFGALISDFVHDLRVRLAVGSLPKIADQVDQFMHGSGLLIAMPDEGAGGFILGDCGGVLMPVPDHPVRSYRWLPVSREIVIGETADAYNVNYTTLSREDVNRINLSSFESSSVVIARRKSDLDYVLRDSEKGMN